MNLFVNIRVLIKFHEFRIKKKNKMHEAQNLDLKKQKVKVNPNRP